MTVPKKEYKLMRGLSDFISSTLNELIVSKEDIFAKISNNNKVFILGMVLT